MLDSDGFEAWCSRNSIAKETSLLIDNIRNSEPVRRVKGRRGNVCGTYPSMKMGMSIQWESHTLELPGVYLNEYDPDVLEYYDQPSILHLKYTVNGRNRGSTYTPDYFEIRRDSAGWVEWKYENELLKISRDKPWKYVQDESGRWRCPPAEDYARKYGLEFHVKTESDLPGVFLRNIRYLEDFILDNDKGVHESSRQDIFDRVHREPGITLRKMLDEAIGYSADDLYYLLVTGGLFVDLSEQALADPHEVNVYINQTTFEAFSLVKDSHQDYYAPEIDITIGQKFGWANDIWTIVQTQEKSVTLANETNDISMPLMKFAYLVNNKEIIPMDGLKPTLEASPIQQQMVGASRKDLVTANQRYTALQAHWRGEDVNISLRTLRDWQKKYRVAEQTVGSGYLGLLPQTNKRGNSQRKIPERVIELIDQVIDTSYESKKQPRVPEVWGELDRLCQAEGIDTPSIRTLYSEIRKRPLEERVGKRQGPRARYQHQPFIYLLDKDTPRHGDRPFEIVHIDHTQLDVEAVSRRKVGLGRPWATFAVDAFSRRVLAIYLSYDPPSYRSCMMVFRQLIQRYSRKPSIVVVDNGKEFDSVYFDAFLNRYRIVKKKRPPHMSRFGSIGERMFGTTNTQLIHNLTGNTQIMKEVRKVSKTFNPKNLAVWNLELLWEFLSIYAYEVYDQKLIHSTLGRSPREEYMVGMADAGYRKNAIVAYDDDFYFTTLPTTRKGTAKVDNRYGIKINNINYWHNALRDSRLSDKQVDVKFDPFNIGIAYAYINKQWIQLTSDYYTTFRGYSVRTIQILSDELRKQKKLQGENSSINARELAQFLLQAQKQEEYLQLFERDEENKRVRRLMESKVAFEEFPKSDISVPRSVSEPTEGSSLTAEADLEVLNETEYSKQIEQDDIEDEDIELEVYEEA